MTQFLKSFLFIFVCVHFGSLRGEEDCLLMSLEEMREFSLKNYVRPEQIYLSDEEIFIQTENGLLAIDSLMTDALGLYYKVDGQKKNDGWICPECTHENDRPCRSKCEKCPWPTSHSLDLQCRVHGTKCLDSERKGATSDRDTRPYYPDPDEREYPSYWDDEDYYDCYGR